MKALLLLASLVTVIPAANLKGKVVGVISGNSLEILSEGKVIGVKIYGIDCPTKTNVTGRVARHFVADHAFMNDVQLEITGAEANGELVGKVILADGKNLGIELLKQGMVWWDKQATPDETVLAKIEKQARDAFMGIWAGAAEDDEENDWGKEVLANRTQTEKGEAGLLTVVERN